MGTATCQYLERGNHGVFGKYFHTDNYVILFVSNLSAGFNTMKFSLCNLAVIVMKGLCMNGVKGMVENRLI